MEKQRQTAAASDKLKRERWKSEETRRIKEATVKSLEPEIQRIIAKGKAEIQKLKAFHEVRHRNYYNGKVAELKTGNFSYTIIILAGLIYCTVSMDMLTLRTH